MVKQKIEIVSKEQFDEAIRLYFLWKDLDTSIKAFFSRGVNLHEAITERIVCHVNGYLHSLGAGSEDALTEGGEKVQVKATSNFNSDLTSFGPKSEFDILHFVRLDRENDVMYLYDISIEELDDIPMNAHETFKDQQDAGRRPRFSIITRYLQKEEEKPYAKVYLQTGEIEKF
ncbi:Bsp6I family type II restriction endonuclease [Priestia flexa]|uniref:Bsp6I family type II restriction endonuclease n=1 Tax=Priestia flexa TaxID=86664 RepID=UPI0024915A16|nr:Bsp6I family type II restriction endonuclease [Priestia flexa]